MGITIAEYLGQRTDAVQKISPVGETVVPKCAFADIPCSKLNSKPDPLKPVCSLKRNGELWISCRDRLCSSTGDTLTSYQRSILVQIAKEIYGSGIAEDNIIYKKETALKIKGTRSSYHADYLLSTKDWTKPNPAPDCVIVEMQGGGETSNTGKITRHIERWESSSPRTNEYLVGDLAGVGMIATNAWRRQQEQLLVKGGIASQSGKGFVICTGTILYDYINSRLKLNKMRDERNTNWNFAWLIFKEQESATPKAGPIPLVIDSSKSLFTQFHRISSKLINQSGPLQEPFIGEYKLLNGSGTYTRT